jgi:hypothetical protein
MFFVVDFELRGRYGEVGHHLLAQDAPSFIQKYMMFINVWSLFACVYISETCMFFIDFHVLAFPGVLVPAMTSASKNQYRQPRFRVQLLQFDAVYIWSKVFSWTTDNSCPHTFLGNNQRNQTSSHTFFLTIFLERIPSCIRI